MKTKIKFLQFYIGNVCNLACPNCASFNNYAFKGQFNWESNKDSSYAWSNILDPDEVAIIGGEPFTNPDLKNWVYGLLDCFSPRDFRITTNGTFLERNIETILEFTRAGVNIEVSSHSDLHYQLHNQIISKYYPTKKISADSNVYTNDSKGFIEIRNATEFFNISIKDHKDGIFYMHNSDPKIAHKNCLVKDCHYVVEGRLYQCVVTATSGLFANQFNVDQCSLDKIKKIKSCSPYDSTDDILNFLNNIDKPCTQCSLCPERIYTEKFFLPNKKIKQ